MYRFSPISNFIPRTYMYTAMAGVRSLPEFGLKLSFLLQELFGSVSTLSLWPYPSSSGKPLHSVDQHDLLVPRTRAAAQYSAYSSFSLFLCNDLPSITRSMILNWVGNQRRDQGSQVSPTASLSVNIVILFFSRCSRTGCAYAYVVYCENRVRNPQMQYNKFNIFASYYT